MKRMILRIARLFVFGIWVHCLPAVAWADAALNLEEVLIGHIWSWKAGKTDTQVVFEKDGTLKVKGSQQVNRWESPDENKVRVTLASGKVLELEFNGDLNSFKESGKSEGGATGDRMRKRTAPATAEKPTPPAAAATRPPPDPKKMTLSPDWLPEDVQTRRELLDSLEFYSLKVLGGKRKNPDLIPNTIWAGVTWLMPVEKAIAMMPKGARKHRHFEMENLAFPQSSIRVKIWALDGPNGLSDRGNAFKYICFLTDLDDRVIGLQLVSPTPKIVSWELPGPDGVREPYYNFIEDRANGTTKYCVPYQVRDAGRGVKLIKTALLKQPDIGIAPVAGQNNGPYAVLGLKADYAENVHWYLTAPLAEKLLEIVDVTRKGGKIR